MRGQVVFRSSRNVTVLADGNSYRCEFAGRLRKKGRNPVVVGDWVEFDVSGDVAGVAEGRVISVEERKAWISRRRDVGKGRELILAANIDQIACVFSVGFPRIKFGALDRLLIAASFREIPSFVILNKIDLGISDEIEQRLEIYPQIGIDVIRTSATSGDGLDQLAERLAGQAILLTGPSGVGKSSLIAKVLGIDIRISEVSAHNEKGKHTTTAVTWHPAADGSAIIDTPGFRDWALWGLAPGQIAASMPDLAAVMNDCHFRDCSHRTEPNCAVKAAVEEGDIHPLRYRSYLGILESVLERQERDR
ncbi:MAG: ribosome small subunit-dependent GTPase A [Planctomycetota bacterium]|nr:MAG: ribosome small subunit-dependent GTPase A [Planctomycetota bacterium]